MGASCNLTGPKALEATGESIVALGVTFNAVGIAGTRACIAKQLAVKTCDNLRAFEQRFKALYPGAKDLWITASKLGDKTSAERVFLILSSLSNDMAPFLALIGGK
jgi:hypothetical protein